MSDLEAATDAFVTTCMSVVGEGDPDRPMTVGQFGDVITALADALKAQEALLADVNSSQQFLRDSWRTLAHEIGATEDGHRDPDA